MKKLVLLLVVLLAFNSNLSASQMAETPQAAKIKAQVQKRGAGEKSRVRVTLANGTRLKGHISKIEETSFEVTGKAASQSSPIAYSEVQKIQGPGLSTGAKVGIGVGVAVVVVAIVFLVGWEEFKHCKNCNI